MPGDSRPLLALPHRTVDRPKLLDDRLSPRSLIKARPRMPVKGPSTISKNLPFNLTGASAPTAPRSSRSIASIKLSLVECVRRTRKDAIELRTIERDKQQIHACVERLNDGRADAVAIDRAHHQIVGNDHALVVPFLANDSVDDTSGMRCRTIRVDRRQRDMSYHELRSRTRQDVPEGTPVGRLKHR